MEKIEAKISENDKLKVKVLEMDELQKVNGGYLWPYSMPWNYYLSSYMSLMEEERWYA